MLGDNRYDSSRLSIVTELDGAVFKCPDGVSCIYDALGCHDGRLLYRVDNKFYLTGDTQPLLECESMDNIVKTFVSVNETFILHIAGTQLTVCELNNPKLTLLLLELPCAAVDVKTFANGFILQVETGEIFSLFRANRSRAGTLTWEAMQILNSEGTACQQYTPMKAASLLSHGSGYIFNAISMFNRTGSLLASGARQIGMLGEMVSVDPGVSSFIRVGGDILVHYNSCLGLFRVYRLKICLNSLQRITGESTAKSLRMFAEHIFSFTFAELERNLKANHLWYRQRKVQPTWLHVTEVITNSYISLVLLSEDSTMADIRIHNNRLSDATIHVHNLYNENAQGSVYNHRDSNCNVVDNGTMLIISYNYLPSRLTEIRGSIIFVGRSSDIGVRRLDFNEPVIGAIRSGTYSVASAPESGYLGLGVESALFGRVQNTSQIHTEYLLATSSRILRCYTYLPFTLFRPEEAVMLKILHDKLSRTGKNFKHYSENKSQHSRGTNPQGSATSSCSQDKSLSRRQAQNATQTDANLYELFSNTNAESHIEVSIHAWKLLLGYLRYNPMFIAGKVSEYFLSSFDVLSIALFDYCDAACACASLHPDNLRVRELYELLLPVCELHSLFFHHGATWLACNENDTNNYGLTFGQYLLDPTYLPSIIDYSKAQSLDIASCILHLSIFRQGYAVENLIATSETHNHELINVANSCSDGWNQEIESNATMITRSNELLITKILSNVSYANCAIIKNYCSTSDFTSLAHYISHMAASTTYEPLRCNLLFTFFNLVIPEFQKFLKTGSSDLDVVRLYQAFYAQKMSKRWLSVLILRELVHNPDFLDLIKFIMFNLAVDNSFIFDDTSSRVITDYKVSKSSAAGIFRHKPQTIYESPDMSNLYTRSSDACFHNGYQRVYNDKTLVAIELVTLLGRLKSLTGFIEDLTDLINAQVRAYPRYDDSFGVPTDVMTNCRHIFAKTDHENEFEQKSFDPSCVEIYCVALMLANEDLCISVLDVPYQLAGFIAHISFEYISRVESRIEFLTLTIDSAYYSIIIFERLLKCQLYASNEEIYTLALILKTVTQGCDELNTLRRMSPSDKLLTFTDASIKDGTYAINHGTLQILFDDTITRYTRIVRPFNSINRDMMDRTTIALMIEFVQARMMDDAYTHMDTNTKNTTLEIIRHFGITRPFSVLERFAELHRLREVQLFAIYLPFEIRPCDSLSEMFIEKIAHFIVKHAVMYRPFAEVSKMISNLLSQLPDFLKTSLLACGGLNIAFEAITNVAKEKNSHNQLMQNSLTRAFKLTGPIKFSDPADEAQFVDAVTTCTELARRFWQSQ